MKKVCCLALTFLLACAFALPADDPFVNDVLRNLLLRVKVQPQEKVYLQTDRDHYQSGERIWFRAYLVDAATHKPSENSRYVYVELVNRMDSVYRRVKISGIDSVYAGYISLPKKLQQGEYFLRAYSYWMQNQSEDFIFKKKIRVVNVDDSKVITNFVYAPSKDDEMMEVNFKNSRKMPYGKVFVSYLIGNNSEKIVRTDDKGSIRIPRKEIGDNREIYVWFNNGEPMEFERRIYLPERSKDFDVQFFPEGGDLIAGNSQILAFKAIGTDGLGKDVDVAIYNEKNEFVSALRSMHKGMGMGEFKFETNHRYYAEVVSSDSVKKKVELPVPKNDGVALRVWAKDSVLNYMLLMGDSTNIKENVYLAVLSRGIPVLCAPLNRTVGRLPLKSFPEGVLQLMVLDSKYNIYTQRLCFVRKTDRPELSIATDKPTYFARDLARLSVGVHAKNGEPLSGSFSVAITDDGQHERDSLYEDHILSNLLLTSDLKGYIEDPGFYFRNINRTTDRFLDMLMLTQGWTRFDLPKVIRGELEEPPYYLEKGQAISGRVKNFWGKNAQQANLVIFSTTGIFQTTQADSSGHFIVDGISFPDSTSFVVQAQSQKGRKSVEVLVDRDEFVKPKIGWPYSVETVKEDGHFYEKFAKDYYYDNGLKVFVLDEVNILARKKTKTGSIYDASATYNVDSAKLAGMAELTMREVLEAIPGIQVDETEQRVTRFNKTVGLFLNDLPDEYNYIMNLRPTDFSSISYLDATQAFAFFGEGGGEGGLLAFTTNPGFGRSNIKPRLNIQAIQSFLGYQKKIEFYVPRYDVDSVRIALSKTVDKRPTIYWNPDVRTDKSGNAEFTFTTSDSYGPYSLIIEGILDNGTICRKEQKIMLKLPR